LHGGSIQGEGIREKGTGIREKGNLSFPLDEKMDFV
jgi:hypothetical protein